MIYGNCKDCKLKSNATKCLNLDDFELLEKNTSQVTFKKGDIIFKENCFTSNVTYLKSGIVKLHKEGPSKEKILKIIKAPTFIDISTIFGNKTNNFSASSLSDSSVCLINSALFKKYIYNNGKFAFEIISELYKNELMEFNKQANQSQKQINGLIAETILNFAYNIYNNDKFNIPLSRYEIGNLVGSSRESVCKVLNTFHKEKIIDIRASEITILKKDLLQQISDRG